MRRDMDLVREILLKVEEHGDPQGWAVIEIEGRSDLEISYHVMLLDHAGLITATDCSSNDDLCWEAKSLTWQGHEFLDSARDLKVWRRVIDAIGGALGSASLSVVIELLKHEARKALGLPTAA